MVLYLRRHRIEVGKVWVPSMPLFVDRAINLSPVHPCRGSSQEGCSEDYHLILGMTAPNERVAFRNRFAAGQPILQFPVILEFVERHDLLF